MSENGIKERINTARLWGIAFFTLAINIFRVITSSDNFGASQVIGVIAITYLIIVIGLLQKRVNELTKELDKIEKESK